MPRKGAARPKRGGDAAPVGASASGAEELEGGLEGADEERRARPFWSGTISFGLVTIPVDLYAATRSTRSSLRMLAPSGAPVSRRYFEGAGKPLEGEQLERGYELDSGEFVVVTDEELDALAPEQSRDIDLTRFVDRDTIPPLFFERAYILAPSGNSNLAYRLLASTLERTRRAGIASFVMRAKQYVVAIVAEQGLLRAETLRFAEELRTPEVIGLPDASEPSAQKVKAFQTAITKAKGGAPTAQELADGYWKRLEALVEKKRKSGIDIVVPEAAAPEEENLAEVIDLVAVLRRSLGQTSDESREPAEPPSRAREPKSKPARAKATKAETSKKPARKRTKATSASKPAKGPKAAKAAKKASKKPAKAAASRRRAS